MSQFIPGCPTALVKVWDRHPEICFCNENGLSSSPLNVPLKDRMLVFELLLPRQGIHRIKTILAASEKFRKKKIKITNITVNRQNS